MRRLFFALVGSFFITYAQAESLDYFKVYQPQEGMSAAQLMQIMYHNKYSLYAGDYQQRGEVLYIDPSGFVRKRIWRRQRLTKAGEGGLAYKDLVVMTYPAEVKGLAVLTWTYEDPQKDQQVWLWIPSLKKVRKISASEDDDAFMGSDFTVEEVSTRRFEDETYKLVGERNFPGYKFEHTGEIKFKEKPCFVVEAIPKKPHWYYAKRVVWLDKDTGGNIFEEYYDKNGKLFKTLFRKWGWTDLGEKKYPTQVSLECKDLRTGHRTVILMKDTKYDQNLSEQDFTVKALMRSRW